jgi:glycosyltransferase involved in cell wall biosynthesis
MDPSSLLDAVRSGSDRYESLAQNADLLNRLEDVAEAYLARGQYDDAVATVGTASRFAELHHPGRLASPRLEAALEQISRHHLPPAPPVQAPAEPRSTGSPVDRVLIVVTETYATGAHTRMVWRWIARDPTRIYSVATTAQRGQMPDGLRDAVASSGGEIVDVPAQAAPLERAGALRALAATADLIVLLDHPDDPIPALALAGLRPRPPVVMFNHSDHGFWIGRGIVDVLMCIRDEAVTVAPRRGFPADRVIRTPHPISGPDGHGRAAREPINPALRSVAREQILGALGWPSDTVLIATVGTCNKWEGPPGHRFLDLVEPVLAAAPQARIVAAGASDEGHWRAMRDSTEGRVVAAGVLANGVGALLTAADIYLETRPLGGTGATAEAAAHGLPVLSGAATELECSVLTSGEGYGSRCIIGHDAYRAMLTRLIADPALRHDLGEQARQVCAAADDAWESAVDCAFELARALGPIEPSEFAPLPEPDERDLLVDWKTTYLGSSLAAMAQAVMLRQLIAENPGLRPLYGSLEHRIFQQLARYPAAFATPPAEDVALRSVVSQCRILSQFGIAERFMIALAPSDAERAVPILEAALAEGPDFELELTLDPDPARVQPAGALLLAA